MGLLERESEREREVRHAPLLGAACKTLRGEGALELWVCRTTGAIQGKEGGIQVLAGLAPSSQTVGSNIREIHEQAKDSSWMTDVNIAQATSETSFVALHERHFALMSFAQMSLHAIVTQPKFQSNFFPWLSTYNKPNKKVL